jgi:hypothetical protein
MRKRYSPELKAEAISLFMASETVSGISTKLAVPIETVRSWVYGRRRALEEGLCSTPTTTILKTRAEQESQHLTSRIKESIESGTKIVQNLLFLIQSHIEKRLTDPTPLDSLELNDYSTLLAKCSVSLERISKVECSMFDDKQEKLDFAEIKTILKNDPFVTFE